MFSNQSKTPGLVLYLEASNHFFLFFSLFAPQFAEFLGTLRYLYSIFCNVSNQFKRWCLQPSAPFSSTQLHSLTSLRPVPRNTWRFQGLQDWYPNPLVSHMLNEDLEWFGYMNGIFRPNLLRIANVFFFPWWCWYSVSPSYWFSISSNDMDIWDFRMHHDAPNQRVPGPHNWDGRVDKRTKLLDGFMDIFAAGWRKTNKFYTGNHSREEIGRVVDELHQ